MRRHALLVAAALALCLAVAAPSAAPPTALTDYLSRPEPAFAWRLAAQSSEGQASLYRLDLTSQEWQGTTWRHALHIAVPDPVEFPGWALLFLTGGSGPAHEQAAYDEERRLALLLARELGAPIAVLTHVPNQPLCGDLSEDALIAYTFGRYLETGDPSWPLLLPMAKSALKAMDAVQQFSARELGRELTSFVVTGPSKRGWTTWLAAASGDPRVKATIPMVIDNLNLPAQMPHQLAMWGRYSDQIIDYTTRGFQEQMATPRGQELVAIVDPYTYRAQLTLPKLIINGASDPYWATDALTLYWDGLVGPKAVLDVPNSGHNLNDRARVLGALAGFFRSAAGGTTFPYPTWRHGETEDKLTLAVRSSPSPREGRIWVAESEDADFRRSRWNSVPMRLEGDSLVGEIPKPAAGRVALFGEAVYTLERRSLNLSTAPRVYPPVPAD